MASNRDREALRLRRDDGLTFTAIADRLNYPDSRAAHRAVQRGLAEPVLEGAVLRGCRRHEEDLQLAELTRHLWELHRRLDPWTQRREEGRVFDALMQVTERRCRLLGLFTWAWSYDQWHRRDVPFDAVWPLQAEARVLERETLIPYRDRSRPPSRTVGHREWDREPRPAVVPDRFAGLVPADVLQLLELVAA